MIKLEKRGSFLRAFHLVMIFFILYGCASKRSVLDSQMFSGAPVPSTFFVSGDLSTNIVYASLSSPDNEVFKGASLMGAGIGAQAVIGWPKIFIGGGADYSKLLQLKSPDDLEDKNASGTLLTGYGQAGFFLKKWRFNFKYFLMSNYTFSQKTLGGKEFVLTKPTGSFGINVTVGGSEGSALSIEVNSLKFAEYSLGGSEIEFKESMRPEIMTYGVVYAIRF